MARHNESSSVNQLVQRVSEGDEKAFEKLYLLYSEKIYHVSRRMNLSHEDAEGIVQEVFLKIWRKRKDLDPTLSINAYFISIVRSLVIKKAKKNARLFAFMQYQIPILKRLKGTDPENELIFAEFDQITREVVERLPEGQKQIFIMRYYDNHSVEEIADKLSLSRRTVENQIFRSTRTVKQTLVKLKIIPAAVFFVMLTVFRGLFFE